MQNSISHINNEIVIRNIIYFLQMSVTFGMNTIRSDDKSNFIIYQLRACIIDQTEISKTMRESINTFRTPVTSHVLAQ